MHVMRLIAICFGLVVSLIALPVFAHDETQADGPEGTAESSDDSTLAFEVRDFGPGLRRAQEILKDNYSGIIERRELGFDDTIEDRIIADLSDNIRAIVELSPLDLFLQFGTPVLLILLALLYLRIMDQRIARMALRRQARIDIHGAEWINKLSRAGVLVLGRFAPFAVLITLSYFPVQALYSEAIWPEVFTEVLWLLAGYRASHAAVVAAFGLRLFDVSDATALRLQRWGIWAVNVIFFWSVLVVVLATLGYDGAIERFAEFLFSLSLAFLNIGLMRLKPEVIEVLRLREESAGQVRLIRMTEKYYHTFMSLSTLLLILGALGWAEATSFILIRAFGAVMVLFSSLRILQWLKRRIDTAVSQAQTREQIELFSGIGNMLRTAGFLFFLYVAIRLLRLWEPLRTLLDIPLVMIGNSPLRPISVIEAVFFLLFAIFLGRLIRAFFLVRVYPMFNVDVGVGYAVNTLVNYAIFVIGVLLGLAALGVNLSSLTVVMASLGVGIGLGLQTFTENLVSGFILLFGRSVKKGDIITVGNVYGRVDDVGARSVVIKTPDNYDMLIPSKALVSGEVINWSYRDPLIRLRIPVGVTYNADPNIVRRVLLDAARSHGKVKQRPGPEVLLMEFGDSSVNYDLLIYYDIRTITRDRLLGQMNFIIWDKLAEANIEIPFPQRDLHVRSIDSVLLDRVGEEE